MLPKRPVASTLVYVLVIFLISVKLHMAIYFCSLQIFRQRPPFCFVVVLALCECLCLLTNQNALFFLFFALNDPFFALNYLISALYFLKTALLFANQNREIFVCILLDVKSLFTSALRPPSDNLLPATLPLLTEDIMDLLNLYLMSTYSQYNGEH